MADQGKIKVSIFLRSEIFLDSTNIGATTEAIETPRRPVGRPKSDTGKFVFVNGSFLALTNAEKQKNYRQRKNVAQQPQLAARQVSPDPSPDLNQVFNSPAIRNRKRSLPLNSRWLPYKRIRSNSSPVADNNMVDINNNACKFFMSFITI